MLDRYPQSLIRTAAKNPAIRTQSGIGLGSYLCLDKIASSFDSSLQHRLNRLPHAAQGSWEAVKPWGDKTSPGVGDETAVVAALSFWDYSLVSDVAGSDTYKATGRCFSVAAGRISYTFSFKGASCLPKC